MNNLVIKRGKGRPKKNQVEVVEFDPIERSFDRQIHF